jgi:hypothetical protein
VKAVARKAIELKTGARALRAILEGLMLEVMYDLPQRDDVTEVIVDAGAIATGSFPGRSFAAGFILDSPFAAPICQDMYSRGFMSPPDGIRIWVRRGFASLQRRFGENMRRCVHCTGAAS